jgi:hypothetical protein
MVYLIMVGSHHFKDEIHVETLDQFDNINVETLDQFDNINVDI